MWTALLQGFALGFPAAAQPGPLQTFYISETLRHGWRRTLPAVVAPLLSDGPILALVLWALTQMPDSLLQLLRLAGSGLLLYLAWLAWRQARQPRTLTPDPATPRQSLFKATLLNLLNPNPYLFWSTVAGPLLLENWRNRPAHGLLFLLGFYVTLVGGLGLIILLFGAVEQFDRQGRVSRVLGYLSALFLAGFGVVQLIRAI